MKTFAGQQIDPLFSFSWLVVFLSLMFCSSVALVLGFTVDPKLALAVSLSLLALLYLFFVVVFFGGRRQGDSWTWVWLLSTRLARQLGYLQLLLRLMFRNPPSLPEQSTRALPVRFLFTDYNRLSSVGGETSMAEMIATLSDACEREFGFLATRLFRGAGPEGAGPLQAVLVSLGSLVGVALLLNIRTWWQLLDSLLHSQRKRLHRAANRMSRLKSEGFMKVLKTEVELMAMMAKTMDGFSQHQTRLTVVIDGLDSCEQDKVLQMLDTVRVLFSKGPFISIFASDPHIIIKAINQNLNSVLRDSNINGHDYMRNIVHLPVFLNSRGLSSARKMCSAPSASNGEANASEEIYGNLSLHGEIYGNLSLHGEIYGNLSLHGEIYGNLSLHGEIYGNLSLHGEIYGNLSLHVEIYGNLSLHGEIYGNLSLHPCLCALPPAMPLRPPAMPLRPPAMPLRPPRHVPQEAGAALGRLLRANQITFNWDRLASWINLTEQWPYRTSWIILYLEESDGVPEQAALKTIYERNIPTTKDVEPLLEIDGDVRSFEVFLSSRTPVLTARDIRTFLPCTEAAPRPSSMYSQVSSPGGGGGPPLPHSSFYSGLAGPQHPFYNR
ncbi:Kinase D-interacting substrate of 220 kDa B, partial [Dissostichus eleginoides]